MSDTPQHVAQLRERKQGRLAVLELQAAQYGLDTPAHIVTEIEQIKADLVRLSVVDVPPASDEVRRVLRRYDQLDLVTQTLAGALMRLTAHEESHKADAQRHEVDAQKEAIERRHRQILLNAWLFLLTALVLALLLR